ncbi:MAG: DNA polymerase III subunit delta' [Dehalococcoidia bacterium]|nr:DNA polymerase III subunit delta' [Dehalococcoidia bacterium]
MVGPVRRSGSGPGLPEHIRPSRKLPQAIPLRAQPSRALGAPYGRLQGTAHNGIPGCGHPVSAGGGSQDCLLTVRLSRLRPGRLRGDLAALRSGGLPCDSQQSCPNRCTAIVIMAAWKIHGQEHLTQTLDRGIRQGQLAHAYLLVGPPHIGKDTLALQLAQAVNCVGEDPPCGQCLQCRRIERGIHPDIQRIVPTPDEKTGRMHTEIRIDQVRAIERAIALQPYEGRYRVFIFEGAERLSPDAANALLKTLEEPPAHVLLLLTAAEEEALLPTIRSRCQRLELRPLPEDRLVTMLAEEHGVSPEDARLLARISGGNVGWAVSAVANPRLLDERQRRLETLLSVVDGGMERRFQYAQELAQQFGRDRNTVREEMGFWLLWWRDLLVLMQQAPELVVNVDWRQTLEDRARRFHAGEVARVVRELVATLERLEQNAISRMALDVLMLTLPAPKPVPARQEMA